ncbi:hypothetical protein GCM10011578_049160 [Streptomyces fuscichromogenes]|uniref:Acyl-[acyl-carrier-protein] dehydrogenase MbtN n=1 Tax=Streptomyces fuscichromogenes TaxID=1324013 RepID=A0A918CSP4_9ACTN|nr:acyl-CoA dehydrogenase family protein [Streptomyces fuscichromogenes]GGN19324.1 hypothetical protein GCM10011578_049160 [Streptomyces fuscichromogenes]
MPGTLVPEEYGSGGLDDYRFQAIVKGGRKRTWLPGLAGGQLIGAIAMTEPGAGSDLQGIRTTTRRDGDVVVLNGQKAFIGGGSKADVVIIVARTDPAGGSKGFSLLLVPSDLPGPACGRTPQGIGLHGHGTSELFFNEVRVPADCLLGTEGRGLARLMERLPLERLSIAVSALAGALAPYDWTHADPTGAAPGAGRRRHGDPEPAGEAQSADPRDVPGTARAAGPVGARRHRASTRAHRLRQTLLRRTRPRHPALDGVGGRTCP